MPLSSGTVALELALRACGVERDDEVLMPALSFVAPAHAVLRIGAIPHFIDIEHCPQHCEEKGLDALTMSLAKCAERLRRVAERTRRGTRNKESGRRLRALLPVQIMGALTADLRELAAQWQLQLVIDAAESSGSCRRDQFVAGDMAILSFNGNKLITSGGGGAVLTNNSHFAEHVRHLSQQARLVDEDGVWHHNELATNARMPALNASLCRAQLHRLDALIERKIELLARYRAALGDSVCVLTDTGDARTAPIAAWLPVAMFPAQGARLAFREFHQAAQAKTL